MFHQRVNAQLMISESLIKILANDAHGKQQCYYDWGLSSPIEHTSHREGPWSHMLYKLDDSEAMVGPQKEQSMLTH